MPHATAATPTTTTATSAAAIHGRVAATVEWKQPQACPVKHQPLAPAQPDMRIQEVWQMPVEHQPLGPPQLDTRITNYATIVVIPLEGQKEALLPLHKDPD